MKQLWIAHYLTGLLLSGLQGLSTTDPVEFECSFEDDSNPVCGMKQAFGQPNFRRETGSQVPLPSVDVTLKSARGHYLYYNSSWLTTNKNNKRAGYETPWITVQDLCVQFYYYLHGLGQDSLAFGYGKRDSNDFHWQVVGDQGNAWHYIIFNISQEFRTARRQKFGFYVQRIEGNNGLTLALDDIKIGNCDWVVSVQKHRDLTSSSAAHRMNSPTGHRTSQMNTTSMKSNVQNLLNSTQLEHDRAVLKNESMLDMSTEHMALTSPKSTIQAGTESSKKYSALTTALASETTKRLSPWNITHSGAMTSSVPRVKITTFPPTPKHGSEGPTYLAFILVPLFAAIAIITFILLFVIYKYKGRSLKPSTEDVALSMHGFHYNRL